MVVKGVWGDLIVERKYSVTEYPTMGAIAKELFCLSDEEIERGSISIQSHWLLVDLKMSSKLFLDEWSYNDGYCYLQIETKPKS